MKLKVPHMMLFLVYVVMFIIRCSQTSMTIMRFIIIRHNTDIEQFLSLME